MAWHFWIDRGGTFTDVVAQDSDGRIVIAKVLSENPQRYDDAAIAGMLAAMGLPPDATLPLDQIADVKMGTTVATNALLERKGARTLLLMDGGFRDLLEIGHQVRPRLFDLDIRKALPLHEAVEEVGGRVDAVGNVIARLDEKSVRVLLARRLSEGFEACAITLIHAWKFPGGEQRLAELARDAGFKQVSTGHAVSPLLGLVARAQTCVADAYLSPVLRRYIDRLADKLDGTPLYFMQSNGGLAEAARFQGKDAILSGPAGGVVGAAGTARAAGFDRIIGFDMGGTSTDVSLYAGKLERSFDFEIAGTELRVPMMAIHTVAAGGGSILSFDGARYRVGPESAGANPGPACYRRGGPLTVTDANVMVGNILPQHFPAIFGDGGDLPLDADIVAAKFCALAAEVAAATGRDTDPRDIAASFLNVAVSSMARAIRRVSLEKGHDPARFVLQCFGGAGGQHACMVADALAMDTVLIHPLAGVLSAYGMGLADQRAIHSQAMESALDADIHVQARLVLERLADAATRDLRSGDSKTFVALTAGLRYAGTDTALQVSFGALEIMRAEFEAAHRQHFGFITPDRALILETVTAELTVAGAPVLTRPWPRGDGTPAKPIAQTELWSNGRAHRAFVHAREKLRAGDRIEGPALICEATATTIVEVGWWAKVGTHGELVLRRAQLRARQEIVDVAQPDPMHLELFNNLFMAAAERMGAVLRNTASSINIKERLDFSCALFDATGNLIANAPHVPVHLGAMGESVRTVLGARRERLKPGDMIVLNNPFNGGTHLPDVTVIAPVFDDTGTELRFFVGNRGHHADIGGMTPGSTPPNSRTLEQEGVVIDNFLLLDGGVFQEAGFRALLLDAAWPARSPDTNIADIRAQIAANEAGIAELTGLVGQYGWPMVSAYMAHVMDNAEESVRRVIDRLSDGMFETQLDNGLRLKVAVRIDRAAREAVIDFTGTDAQQDGNFNAPPAVTRAVVLFIFRCLVATGLPLNEGCLKPLKIVIPDGTFLSPRPGSAVVAGNTEVSQVVANALLAALGAAAASQGTMNNFLFGNARQQYYETICGGAGAGPGFEGASAVHTHMTNTRITDPEILEMRYPVRLEEFSVRRGSGGKGRWHGGDGVVRRIRMLEPTTASLVSSSRQVPPHGLDGGAPGAPGQQWILRADGSQEALPGVAQVELNAGDAIIIETPGGGGFG